MTEMRFLSRKTFLSAIEPYTDAQIPSAVFLKFIKENDCKSLEEFRQKYAKSVDQVYDYTIFNMKGNKYRLIVQINYTTGIIYFKAFLTHAEYDKINWNNKKEVEKRIG